ncbi:MAG TPA: DUF488 domain-containing protein [Patescibacteria group bacterium]|nr:DUF488 domain-containing protein [Patescibacteria group bacterium]
MAKEAKIRNSLYTIGYEGRNMADFISCLKSSNISIVLDVRETPISRKKGFSKSALKTELEKEGLAYFHMRELGSPKDMRRKLYEDQDYDFFFRSFIAYLKSKQSHLEKAYALAFKSTCCLMCYEKQAEKCHRSVVAQKIAECDGRGLSVIHI